MTATSHMMVWLGLCAVAGCLEPLPPSAPPVRLEDSSAPAAGTVVDVPAVNQTLYPDNIGFVYQGPLANILWLQSQPQVTTYAQLQQRIRQGMLNGMTGEFLSSSMQQLDPVPSTEPALAQMAMATVQSLRQASQYEFTASDYGSALSTAIATYNADPVRHQALAASATRLDATFKAMAASSQVSAPPAALPPASQAVLRPGVDFADAVRARAQANLATSAAQLEAAISSRNPTAYATAFYTVFLMQRDVDLTESATLALSAHHRNGLLQGQPLDAVIAKYVEPLPTPERPLSIDQLTLLNQINLLASDPSASKPALVGALLLINEDHREGEVDATLSCALIWQHIADETWLVSQLVRLKADGTTADQLTASIASIVAGL